MPCLLYCVTLISADPVSNLVGVSDRPVQIHDSAGFRIYWSELADPEVFFADGVAKRTGEQRYQRVLREVVTRITPIAVPFPAVIADLEALDKLVEAEEEFYGEALARLADTVQYEMTATWAADAQTDLAAPVSGREYLQRRKESEARVAAIDAKLKAVTAGVVREWRSRQERRKHVWFALVLRSDRDRFIACLRTAGPSEGVRLRLSGPWPPGEFVRPQHEMK